MIDATCSPDPRRPVSLLAEVTVPVAPEWRWRFDPGWLRWKAKEHEDLAEAYEARGLIEDARREEARAQELRKTAERLEAERKRGA